MTDQRRMQIDEVADRRVAASHTQPSGAAAFATHLQQQEEQLRFARETRT
jgi:hypothetical protein